MVLILVYANFFYEESWKFKIIHSKTYEYDNEWQVILKSIVKNNIESVKQIDKITLNFFLNIFFNL